MRFSRCSTKGRLVQAANDLGTIVREQGERFVRTHRTTAVQRRALVAIAACRTPALGGHLEQCDHCGHERRRWHSCRNRSCPKCGGAARAAWLEDREKELLPVPYFHVVFTVPEQLNILALSTPRVFYALLFRAAGTTLLEIARSKLHVLAGLLAILHTWSQTMMLHPHIHCVVPGGGFSERHGRWVSVKKPKFFLPVKVLSLRFRTNFCTMLDEAFAEGRLRIDESQFRCILALVRTRDWVVYCKAPFAGPRCVLRYLANYTHRIAISDYRIVHYGEGKVTFRYRDAHDGDKQKPMTLEVDEFLRRFLLHVPPPRFVRIRYFGFLANRLRAGKLEKARIDLAQHPGPVDLAAGPVPVSTLPSLSLALCPNCQSGRMIVIELLSPRSTAPSYQDSS